MFIQDNQRNKKKIDKIKNLSKPPINTKLNHFFFIHAGLKKKEPPKDQLNNPNLI